MNLITDNYIKSIAQKLSKPQNTPYFSGLYQGKTGLAIFFCHYASYSQNDLYNDMAYNLITEISKQLNENTVINYPYGLSGIGAGIEYLVQRTYFEADTDEILADIDTSVSHHLTDYSALSSFNQIKGIGKYLSFRIKTTKRQSDIKDSIERVVNLIEMQLMRTPFCRPDVLSLLYAFRNISEKASVLFADNIKLFNLQLVREFPFEWFYFFHKTKEENQNSNIIDAINQLILDERVNLTNTEYLIWTFLSGNNVTIEQLSDFINQFETVQNFGLINGLTGIGLTLLTLVDKQNETWIELL
jgi:lantibiotic modifying enzyme